jgi:GST-like protein
MTEPLPIEAKWPILDRSKLQLFSLNTPNGQKVAVALEEAFKSVSPNSKIPAILDFDGPGGQPIALMESGAILVYLAEKAGRLLPADPARRYKCLQWLFFQHGGVGPMFGQFGHFFKYARDKCDHPYPLERYTNEAKRLLGVLEVQLTGREYLADEFSIADITTFPWVRALDTSYGGGEVIPITDYPHVKAWLDRCTERPSFQIGKDVTKS